MPEPDGDCELTILMPCLNERETLATCIDKANQFLRSRNVRGEVLIADNGSTDGSQQIALNLGARVVSVPARGYGAALIAGISNARGAYIVMGDSDDSYDFSKLDDFLEKLRGGAELVMGNRFKGGIASGAMPMLHRYLGNPVLSFLGRLFFRVPLGDFHCGLRGLRRTSMLSIGLQCTGMEFASEMIVKSSLARLKIAEVPTTLQPDGRSRPPHLRTWRDGWRHLKFLLTFGLDWLFLYPGLALLIGGAFGTTLLFGGSVRVRPNLGLDVHTFLSSCMFMILGFQCLTFYVFARRRAAALKWLPATPLLMRWLEIFNLDRAVLIGAIVGFCGLAMFGYAIVCWRSQDLGVLPYASLMRPLTMGLTMLVVAFQVMFTGFLADVFATEKNLPEGARLPNAPSVGIAEIAPAVR